MKTLESLNQRLATVQFINNAADEMFFGELVASIRGMAERNERNVEKDIPDIREAGAWCKAWAIRKAFIELERSEQLTKPKVSEHTRSAWAVEQDWNEFLRTRSDLVDLVKRDHVDKFVIEYIGLLPGDLDSPADENPETRALSGGKKPGWQKTASRIGAALSRLRNLRPEEKHMVPFILQHRQQAAEIQHLNRRLEAIEQFLVQSTSTESAAA